MKGEPENKAEHWGAELAFLRSVSGSKGRYVPAACYSGLIGVVLKHPAASLCLGWG